MNVPAPPPIELANLDNLASNQSLARRPRPIAMKILRALGTVGTAGAAGTLAWRLAPVLAPTLPRLLAPLLSLGRARQRSRRRNLLIGAGAGLAVLGVLGWQLQRLFTAKPKHEVERRVGHLEIRRYPSIRVAETTVTGAWDAALDQGFRRLAAFISGRNDAHKRIAMTAPVLATGDGESEGTRDIRFAFVLPDDGATPIPDDPSIEVKDVPARHVAVLRYHGRYNAAAIEAHTRELMDELRAAGLEPRGQVMFAGYDPPWTLPLLRRNELWVAIDAPT